MTIATADKLNSDQNKQLYSVNLDNYLHQQFNNKLNLNNLINHQQKAHYHDHNKLFDNRQSIKAAKKKFTENLKDTNLNANFHLNLNTSPATRSNRSNESSVSNCFSCFDCITDFVERRLNEQPIYNLIKCFIVLLTITQFCIFILSVITYKNNEKLAFHSMYGPYFVLGTNLANLNALLSTIFYLYSIIAEVWPLLALMTTLQAFYSIIELLALLTEPIKVQYIYIVFIMLTSLQTLSMLLFVVMLRIKQLKERSLNNVNYV